MTADEERTQIEQLPEGYCFVVDSTLRLVPAGHTGLLPLATGTVEYVGLERRGQSIAAAEHK